MRAFPQIGPGALAQFPFQRSVAYRTATGSPDGNAVYRYSDPDFEERRWRLSLTQLMDSEWQQVMDLFEEVSGRLGTFLFLEPGANLLRWSERFSEEDWSSTATSILAGQSGPYGDDCASLITSAGPGTLSQMLVVPSHYSYVASCDFRTATPGVQLRISDGSGLQSATDVVSDENWRRYETTLKGNEGTDSVEFQISLPAGAQAEVAGAQVEAQTTASQYKKTLAHGGIYPAARFDQDALLDTLSAPGAHSGEVYIIWTPSLI